MTTVRQLHANRDNAKASTGPKTKAGKARAAKNSLRHGLGVSVWSEPSLAPQAEAIALRIAGPNAEAEALGWARRIGEAQVDINRVRSLRSEMIVGRLSRPHYGSRSEVMRGVRLVRRLLSRKRNTDRPFDIETLEAMLPKPLEGRGMTSWQGFWSRRSTSLGDWTDMNAERYRDERRPFVTLMRVACDQVNHSALITLWYRIIDSLILAKRTHLAPSAPTPAVERNRGE